MSKVNVVIDEKNGVLRLTMPIERQVSSSGKMELLSTSRGNQETDATFEGKPVYANVNIGTFIVPKKSDG
jgi:hypothetical protein